MLVENNCNHEYILSAKFPPYIYCSYCEKGEKKKDSATTIHCTCQPPKYTFHNTTCIAIKEATAPSQSLPTG
ncbi:hypothetical protein MtrunA17_Chr8g0382171 [Medicago truncatula]|uniref:Uncharacterized protein n=1 Tax=Medicago truncatula TaxID=3880 RepID=I3T2S2_MEDTR|nr:unknown [Medicago truncatula]RHN42917.1 hypothetical protein MtrunA17_Chr8g0382171 [Medicago truncatula]